MRRRALLLFFTFTSVASSAQFDLEKDFNYNVNDYFLFSDGFWPYPTAAPKYTDYGKSTRFIITSKTKCGSCFKYSVKGVVDDYSIFVDQDAWTSSTTHGYHPFTDTLYFCSTNPSSLAYFQAYKKRMLSGPRPATTSEVTFIYSTFQSVSNYPPDIIFSDTITFEKLPVGARVSGISGQVGKYKPIYTLETTCDDGADNHYFEIRDNVLYVREVLPDFATRQSLQIRIKGDSWLGGFKRRNLTIQLMSDDGNVAPRDILLSKDTMPYDLLTGATVGLLTALDDNSSDTFDYKLVDGQGDDDNSMFSVRDSLLLRRFSPGIWIILKDTLRLRVQAFDKKNGFFEKPLKLIVGRDTNCQKPVIKQEGNCLSSDGDDQIEWFIWYKDGQSLGTNYYYYGASRLCSPAINANYSIQFVYKNGCIAWSDPFKPIDYLSNGGGNCNDRHVSIFTPGGSSNSLDFRAHTASNQGNTTFIWRRNNQVISTAQNIIAEEPGEYRVTAIFPDACSASATRVISSSGCYVPIILQNGNALRATFGASFSWYLNGEKLDATSQELVALHPGSYEVEVTYESGCLLKSMPVIVYDVYNDCYVPTLSQADGKLMSSPAKIYAWFKDGKLLSQTGQQIEITESGDYTVTVTYENGCSKTSATLTIDNCDLYPKPYIATQWSGLIAAIPYAPENKYKWYLNGVALSTTREEIPVENAGDYTVQIEYPNGCTRMSEAFRCHEATLGKDCLKPEITVNGTQLTCEVNAYFPGYSWIKNGEILNGYNSEKKSLFINGTGYYSVSVAYRNGCIKESDPIAFYFFGSDCMEPDIDQVGSILQSSIGSSYTWHLNGEPLGDNARLLEITSPGEYQVTVTYPNGCTKSSALYPVSVTNAEVDSFQSTSLSVFPNPTNYVIVLRSSFDSLPFFISITNSLGQSVPVNELSNAEGNAVLDLRELPAGIYILHVQRGKNRWLRKVVKN